MNTRSYLTIKHYDWTIFLTGKGTIGTRMWLNSIDKKNKMVIWTPTEYGIINHGDVNRNIGHTLRVPILGAVSALSFLQYALQATCPSLARVLRNATPNLKVRFDIRGESEEPFALPTPKKLLPRQPTLTKSNPAFDIFR